MPVRSESRSNARRLTLPEPAFISLGSNIEPEIHLPRAIIALEALGRLAAISQVYQNPAIGPSLQADFLNAAALVETELQPLEIRRILRGIEGVLGRVRGEERWGPRTLDLDILLFGDQVMDSAELTIPHAGMHLRNFVLYPLYEIAPELEIPGHGALRDLLGSCEQGGLEPLKEQV